MNTHCNVQCSRLHCNVQCSRLQFAKRLLEGSSISTPLDPGYEGGTIAAEVLDSSDSLRELCAKCGRNLTCGGLPLITCTGICQPRRTLMDVKILSTDCA